MTPDRKLLDLMLRHQLYLERYKDGEEAAFAAVLVIITRQFRRLFSEIEPENLGELTRMELRRFINKLNTAQMQVYDAHTAKLLQSLKEFMRVDRGLLTNMYGSVIDIPRNRVQTVSDLWDNARREPMGATGETVTAFISGVVTSAVDSVTKEVRRGYADNMTTKTVLQNIVGTAGKNYRDGLFRRINNWHRAMVPTTIQHISQFTTYQISRLFFERYQWVSVMDDRTTVICTERNGRIYIYGTGPRPPAHIRCRSSIVPITESSYYNSSMSWRDWFSSQPEGFQTDAARSTPLTLDGFRRKEKRILTGD